MQLSRLKMLASTVHQLPIAKQQEILDFSLFLKSNLESPFDEIKLTENKSVVEININESK